MKRNYKLSYLYITYLLCSCRCFPLTKDTNTEKNSDELVSKGSEFINNEAEENVIRINKSSSESLRTTIKSQNSTVSHNTVLWGGSQRTVPAEAAGFIPRYVLDKGITYLAEKYVDNMQSEAVPIKTVTMKMLYPNNSVANTLFWKEYTLHPDTPTVTTISSPKFSSDLKNNLYDINDELLNQTGEQAMLFKRHGKLPNFQFLTSERTKNIEQADMITHLTVRKRKRLLKTSPNFPIITKHDVNALKGIENDFPVFVQSNDEKLINELYDEYGKQSTIIESMKINDSSKDRLRKVLDIYNDLDITPVSSTNATESPLLSSCSSPETEFRETSSTYSPSSRTDSFNLSETLQRNTTNIKLLKIDTNYRPTTETTNEKENVSETSIIVHTNSNTPIKTPRNLTIAKLHLNSTTTLRSLAEDTQPQHRRAVYFMKNFTLRPVLTTVSSKSAESLYFSVPLYQNMEHPTKYRKVVHFIRTINLPRKSEAIKTDGKTEKIRNDLRTAAKFWISKNVPRITRTTLEDEFTEPTETYEKKPNFKEVIPLKDWVTDKVQITHAPNLSDDEKAAQTTGAASAVSDDKKSGQDNKSGQDKKSGQDNKSSKSCTFKDMFPYLLPWLLLLLLLALLLPCCCYLLLKYLMKKRRKANIPEKWTDIGTLRCLYIYPVKSCEPLKPCAAECTKLGLRDGLLRDRFFFVTNENKRCLTATHNPEIRKVYTAYRNNLLVLGHDLMNPLLLNLRQIKKTKQKFKATVCGDKEITVYDCGCEPSQWFTRVLNSRCEQRLVCCHKPKLNRYKNKIRDCDKNPCSFNSPYHLISEKTFKDINSISTCDSRFTINKCRPNFIVNGCDDDKNWSFVKIGNNVFEVMKTCNRYLKDSCCDLVHDQHNAQSSKLWSNAECQEKSCLGLHMRLRSPPGKVQVGDTVSVAYRNCQCDEPKYCGSHVALSHRGYGSNNSRIVQSISCGISKAFSTLSNRSPLANIFSSLGHSKTSRGDEVSKRSPTIKPSLTNTILKSQ